MLLLQETLFLEPAAFDLSYVPDRVIGRETEISQINRYLNAALRQGTPNNFMAYGASGTGKTLVMRKMTKELIDATDGWVKIAYVNCNDISAETHIIRAICYQLDENIKINPGLGKMDYYRSLYGLMNGLGGCFIIVLDEINKMNGDGLLYSLSRAGENRMIDYPKVTNATIGISNEPTYGMKMNSRVKSSFGSLSVTFHDYNYIEVEQILKARTKIGFKKDVINSGVIPLIAVKSKGDARRALLLLQQSGIEAQVKNEPKITESLVKLADEVLSKNEIENLIFAFSIHKKAIVYSILTYYYRRKHTYKSDFRKNFLTSGESYDLYSSLCNNMGLEPVTEVWFSNLLGDLETTGLIRAPMVSMGKRGRTRQISLSSDLDMMLDNLTKKLGKDLGVMSKSMMRIEGIETE